MLYCMALTVEELEFLSSEIKRVLKPDGLNVYTTRHTGDAQYGQELIEERICTRFQAAL